MKHTITYILDRIYKTTINVYMYIVYAACSSVCDLQFTADYSEFAADIKPTLKRELPVCCVQSFTSTDSSELGATAGHIGHVLSAIFGFSLMFD